MGIFFIGPCCLNPSVKLFRSDRTIIYNKVVIKTIFPNFFMPLTIFGTPVQYLCIVKTIRETATRCKSSMRSCRTSAWRRKRHGAYRHLDDGDTRADGALSKPAFKDITMCFMLFATTSTILLPTCCVWAASPLWCMRSTTTSFQWAR